MTTSAAMPVAPAAEAVLSLESVSKTFGVQRALDAVNLTIEAGEVHALVGQNGCGKSTMVKILSGVYTPDAGSVASVSGQRFQLGSVSAANAAGLRFVHQDLGLIADLSVAENFYMTSHRGWVNKISAGRERSQAAEALEAFGYTIDPRALVGSLSAAQRTAVAIVRALDGERPPPLLVLDEPTASLPGPDAELLFDALRRLTRAGSSVLFISHHLDEVLGLANRVTVLRDGHHIATTDVRDLSYDGLVEQMLGRVLTARSPKDIATVTGGATGVPRLRVQGLRGARLDGVDLSLQPGEVLGIAGLTGSGREDIAGAIAGQTRLAGTVEVDGQTIKPGDPADALRRGLGYAPAERRRDALLTAATLRENLTIADITSVSTRGRVSRRLERKDAARWMAALEVRPPDQERTIVQFSGGNQQKVVLGRLLRTNPGVLVLDEPTQGVDVGAKAMIHDLIVRAAADGAAVIVCSSDVEELIQVSTRVVVLRRGRIGAELSGADLTVESIEEEQLQPAKPESTLSEADGATSNSENGHE